MKVVINACFGGFTLSNEAMAKLVAPETIEEFYRRTWGDSFTGPLPGGVRAMEVNGEYRMDTMQQVDGWHSLPDGMKRSDPKLVAVVEELGGEAAAGRCANLRVVEIPDGVDYEIDEYDGRESIHEKHRSWA